MISYDCVLKYKGRILLRNSVYADSADRRSSLILGAHILKPDSATTSRAVDLD